MRLTFGALLCGLAAGCGGMKSEQASETNYSLAGPSSAGLTWQVEKETIHICYSDDGDSDTRKSNVIYAVKEWIRGIGTAADGQLATNVELVDIDAECDASVFIGNYEPAYTEMGRNPSVHLDYSGWYGSKTVTLHEFGHAFGLLDTYLGRGGACESGQPDSVMCWASYETLQPDDVAGIKEMYRRVSNAVGRRETDENEGRIVY